VSLVKASTVDAVNFSEGKQTPKLTSQVQYTSAHFIGMESEGAGFLSIF
jgi:hypothetical protein